MRLKEVQFAHFRCFAKAGFRPDGADVLLLGENGSGKTTVLEAVYLLSTGRSFRSSRVDDMRRHGQQTGWVSGVVRDPWGDVELKVILADGHKTMISQGQQLNNVEYLGKFRTLAYSWQALEVIRGGPQARRRFFDAAFVGIEPKHLRILARFLRCLKQRNSLLRQPKMDENEVSTWDWEYSGALTELVESRRKTISEIARRIPDIVNNWHAHKGSLKIEYRPRQIDYSGDAKNDRERIMEKLKKIRQQEQQMGRSLVGAHLDEISILWDGRDSRRECSSGEQRSAYLTLMATVAFLQKEQIGQGPVLLLDDLDAEIDEQSMFTFLGLFESQFQMLCTSSKPRLWQKGGWKSLTGFLEKGALKSFG